MADTPQKAIVHLEEATFQKTLDEATTPILVDFYADWCGPCKMAAPVLEKLATEMTGKIMVGKVNVDESSSLAQQFGVMSIPTVIMMQKKDGKLVEVDRKVGFPGEDGYRQMMTQVIGDGAAA